MDCIIDRVPAGLLGESGVEGTIIRPPSRESAAMTEELSHGGGDLSSPTICWNISINGRIEPHLARVKQSHHRRRRGNRLGQRRQIEDCVKRHTSLGRDERSMTDGRFENMMPLVAHRQNSAGEVLRLDPLRQQP
jgi:hypothetical protein